MKKTASASFKIEGKVTDNGENYAVKQNGVSELPGNVIDNELSAFVGKNVKITLTINIEEI
ncbi:MAG TPA: hypothetical protein VNX68_13195 [Nitrosopumilaceae archaeon]|jgi:hypothetical protein|nr:hypothetical protein [Nitrosopumilaceae archaeon]